MVGMGEKFQPPPPPWEEHEQTAKMLRQMRADPSILKIARPGARSLHSVYQEIVEGKPRHSVGVRFFESDWGAMTHLIIHSADNLQPSWGVKQTIKDVFAGSDRVAIEVFPLSGNVVDMQELWHLWVLPENFELPFSLEGL